MLDFIPVEHHGFDENGRERLRQREGLVVCDSCDTQVELWSKTNVWTKRPDGRMYHKEFGTASGVCEACQLLYVMGFEGPQCFRLSEER